MKERRSFLGKKRNFACSDLKHAFSNLCVLEYDFTKMSHCLSSEGIDQTTGARSNFIVYVTFILG